MIPSPPPVPPPTPPPDVFGCTDSDAANYDPSATAGRPEELCQYLGCVAPAAINYDSLATQHDFSCVYPVFGCTDSVQMNFNPLATDDDASCDPYVPGCSQDQAANWDSLATADDGSCRFQVVGCADSTAINYYSAANQDDGSCILPVLGCLSPIADNFESNATVDDGSCTYSVSGCMDSRAINFLSQATVPGAACVLPVPGCMVPSATNFDSQANTDDGSCEYVVRGCMDSSSINYNSLAEEDTGCIPLVIGCLVPSATNFNSLASLDDGSCIFAVPGCMDSGAMNFLESATIDDGSCRFFRLGCMAPSALTYDSAATVHDNDACVFERLGCTDSTAFNYNSIANTDDLSCVNTVSGCTDDFAANFDSTANVFNTTSCVYHVIGCTDSGALNFNPIATRDNGLCVPLVSGCTVDFAVNYDSTANSYDGSCIFVITGCTDSSALNFFADAVEDDGSCIARVLGCVDDAASNYDSGSTVNDGSCVYPPSGCTDSRAINFNPTAVQIDDSCRLPGCTSSLATNFAEYANLDDGSCILPPSGCPDSIAPNYLSFAVIDDGTCVVLGCTDSSASNYASAANSDDGSCVPWVVGCADSLAANYRPTVTLHLLDRCLYPGCTFSEAKNYDATASVYDGSCVPYARGCTDSRAINYNLAGIAAEVDDGTCAIPGCTGSMATNYNPDANFDDASCVYQRASGVAASFGYLAGCEAFVDSNSDLIRDGDEQFSTTNNVGFYSVIYRETGPVQTQSSADFACVDSITGNSLSSPLRSTVGASISSQLTTVASALMQGGDRLRYGLSAGVNASVANSYSETEASALVCESMVPCIPCGLGTTAQSCDATSECLEVCSKQGSPISVFSFDALNTFLLGDFPDTAWAAWLVAQINSENSISCSLDALECGSPDLCGAACDDVCTSVGAYSAAELGDELYATLASMALEGPVKLENASGAPISRMIMRTAERLSIQPRRVSLLADSCGETNALTYQVLTGSSGRRRLQGGARDNTFAGVAQPSQAAMQIIQKLVDSLRSSSSTSVARRGRALSPPAVLTYGCTDQRAVNYDLRARLSDGSCIVLGCTSSDALNHDASATRDDGSCVLIHRGCTVPSASNFQSSANSYDGSCIFPAAICSDPLAANHLAAGDCLYTGCTSPRAVNFNADAVLDDGSCQHPRRGCTSPSAANYHSHASEDDGSCIHLGCTSTSARNFNPGATVDDASCEYAGPRGCTHIAAANYDARARANDGSCIHLGCTDPTRPNFSPKATIDDGSCGAHLEGCRNPRADNYLPNATVDAPCALRGCTTAEALNFDADATVDDNSCVTRRPGCVDTNAMNYLPTATDDDGSCYILGCTDSRATNHKPTATVDDGTCLLMAGCMDAAFADNFDPRARVPDKSCVYLGCTDPSAINYDANAMVDDGGCEWLPSGLTTLFWPGPSLVEEIGAAPVLFADGAVRRVALQRSHHSEASELIEQPLVNGGLSVLAVGAESEDFGAAQSAGAVYLMATTAAGALRVVRRVPEIGEDEHDRTTASLYRRDRDEPGLLSLRAFDHFGCAIQHIGDLDGDGITELAVGARGDNSGAQDAGAVYVLFLDTQARLRRYVKVTRPEAGGLFGSALGAPSGGVASIEHPHLVVGAPGHDGHRGAVHLLFFNADGSLAGSTELSPATWGEGGPGLLASNARLGATVAMSLSSTGYEISAGAPGMEGEAGVVLTLHMVGRDIRGFSPMMAPDRQRTPRRHFGGSALAYSADLNHDGSRELIVGAGSTIYTILTGPNQTGAAVRWFTAFDDHQMGFPYGSDARPVAIVRSKHAQSAGASPLLWLARPRGPLGIQHNSSSTVRIAARPAPSSRGQRRREQASPSRATFWAGTGLAAALATYWVLSKLVRCRARGSMRT